MKTLTDANGLYTKKNDYSLKFTFNKLYNFI